MKNLIVFVSTISFVLLSMSVTAQWTNNGSKLTTFDNVGIGTSTPASGAKLDIKSGNLNLSNNYGITTNGGATMYTGSSGQTFSIKGGTTNSRIVNFSDNQGNTKVFINNLGNMAIGADIPQTKLDVNGTILAGARNAKHHFSTLNGSEGIIMPGTTADFLMSTQDGNGRVQMKWNATYGTNEKFLVSGEDASFIDWKGNVSGANWIEFKHANGASAGSNINWNTHFVIKDNGNIGIGTTTPDNKLDVNGTIRAKAIKVESGWSDYVFYDNYLLPTLLEEEEHIQAKGYLLGFESEVEMNGEVNLGDATKRQQAKLRN